MNYNKTFQLEDYQELAEMAALFDALERRVTANVDHAHRRWEYGLALTALLEHKVQSVLEIGSGGSLFAPLAALCGLSVTCVDPGARVGWVAVQAQQINRPIAYFQSDLAHFEQPLDVEAVVCLSTIEHVVEDAAFFDKALSYARHLAVFTTDFSMDGCRYSPDHLRTYSPSMLMQLAQRAAGWQLPAVPEWLDHGRPIFGKYNFASLCLRRDLALPIGEPLGGQRKPLAPTSAQLIFA